MIVRNASPEDNPTIQEIHTGQGIDYKCPDLESPLFFVRKVVEQDGKVIGACYLRLTAETYLFLSPELDPIQKMDAMEAMQPEVIAEAWEKGIDEIEARISTETEQIFNKRLSQLGWIKNRDGWHPWTRSTK